MFTRQYDYCVCLTFCIIITIFFYIFFFAISLALYVFCCPTLPFTSFALLFGISLWSSRWCYGAFSTFSFVTFSCFNRQLTFSSAQFINMTQHHLFLSISLVCFRIIWILCSTLWRLNNVSHVSRRGRWYVHNIIKLAAIRALTKEYEKKNNIHR